MVIHADSHLHTCTYICRIIHNDTTKTDARRITQEDFFNNILPLTLFVRFRKGCSRVACERELETEHKLQYFDPTVMTVTLYFSCSLRLPNRGPRAQSAGCWLSSLHLSIFPGPQSPSRFPRAPTVGWGFPYHIWSLAVWNSTGNCSWTRTQLS